MEKRAYSNTHTTYMKILVTHAIVQVSTLILKKIFSISTLKRAIPLTDVNDSS